MKTKGLKIAALILAVITAGSAAAFFFTRKKDDKKAVDTSAMPVLYNYQNSEYSRSEALSVKGTNGEIFVPSSIDGLYYTADLKNNVAFYEYAGGAFTPCASPVKTVNAGFTASFEKINVKVSYVEKDGKVFGCGVYYADSSSPEAVPYAFVEVVNKPAGYGDGYLLLADLDPDELYRSDKIFSEIFSFNLTTGSASGYVSNNTRLVDSHGNLRRDWTMLTNDFIKNMGSSKYFLSSRYYTEAEREKRADIMVLSNAYRPEIAVKDILGLWFVSDANGLHYLKKTAKGFSNVLNVNKKENVLTEFEGDFFTDYLQCGKYIINKKSLVMTDLMTGAAKTLGNINIEKADEFSVNGDGTKAVFACKGEANASGTPIQTLIYCTVDGSAEPAIYSEPLLYSESCGFAWLDNSSVMSARALDTNGAVIGSAVYTF